MDVAALVIILSAVLFGPLVFKPIEHNVEVFFLAVGVLTAMVTGRFDWGFVNAAVTEPASLAIAVLAFGVAFRLARPQLERIFARICRIVRPRWICFVLILVLGALAGFITAIVAAVVLVEAISLLRLDRRTEISMVVVACFAIGFGAGLTPLGMPASTMVLSALHADFWYLARLLGPFIGVGIVLAATLSLLVPWHDSERADSSSEVESWSVIVVRAGKVYAFVAGLVGLARGLRPLAETYLDRFPGAILFWFNSLSAVVDNATLAAIEIGPSISRQQQRSLMLALLISGGMLIPGNIPNIIAANRLGISSREWARVGLLIGLPLMLACFLVLHWMG
jgi:predicted cation transporter